MALLLRILLIVAFWAPVGASVSAEALYCQNETPCETENGLYYMHWPKGVATDRRSGAVFFLHGHRGKAVNEIRNKSFKAMADELGVAFVAVQGVEGTWSFPNAPRSLRNEFQFFDEVIEDVTTRFPVDPQKLMLSGFSSGGFMTWYLACENAERFAGYAPIAGAFWKPLPDDCPTTAPYLFHVHGTKDTVVPLEGRPLGGGRWHQGDVFESFDVWRRQEGLLETAPEAIAEGGLRCERWAPEDGLLELCLHENGHSVRADWLKRAWRELEAARGWSY